MGRRAPGLRRPRRTAPRSRTSTATSTSTSALGDTAAMAGHSPPATVAAVQRRLGEQGGATLMLPTEDAAWVGEELARRFGVPQWSFALTATDANRWALRLCRADRRGRPVRRSSSATATTAPSTRRSPSSTGVRPRSRARATSAPPSIRRSTTRVVRVQRPRRRRARARRRRRRLRADRARADEHRHRPARARLPRGACARPATATGTLLIIDETHTISAGPGGCTAAWGLRPDLVTIGKAHRAAGSRSAPTA